MPMPQDDSEVVYEYFWANKWLIDGAKTLGDMAQALYTAAQEIEEMEKTGAVDMHGEVEGGIVMLTTSDPDVAAQFGFGEMETDE